MIQSRIFNLTLASATEPVATVIKIRDDLEMRKGRYYHPFQSPVPSCPLDARKRHRGPIAALPSRYGHKPLALLVVIPHRGPIPDAHELVIVQLGIGAVGNSGWPGFNYHAHGFNVVKVFNPAA